MEIAKMLIISSAHITESTASLLDEEAVGITVYQKDNYGWFIVVTDWQERKEYIPDDLNGDTP
jgi:hypothetical protein